MPNAQGDFFCFIPLSQLQILVQTNFLNTDTKGADPGVGIVVGSTFIEVGVV